MKLLIVPAIFVFLSGCCWYPAGNSHCQPDEKPTPTVTITPPPLPTSGVFRWEGKPLVGITFDDVSDLSGITKTTASLPKPNSVRIVFDYPEKPAAYKKAMAALTPITTVMAQPFDSTYIQKVDLAGYKTRFAAYMDEFLEPSILWEVGNEVNGEWAGEPAKVGEKVVAAYRMAKERRRKTVLTPILNNDGKSNCWKYPSEDMFTWLDKYIPADVAPDFVLVSYYEQDCPIKPDWNKVFTQLAARFPTSYVGFGEVGTENGDKSKYAQKYYSMKFPGIPAFAGGGYWWYCSDDCIGETSLLKFLKGLQ